VAGGRGFSLIEVLISVVIFSAVILALAGLAFQVARRSTRATDQAQLMGMLQSKVDLAATIAFDSLSLVAGCDTTITGNVQIIGCITITSQTTRMADVLVTARTSVPGGRPDTVRMQRSKPRLPIPIS
jgi:prepilin-type N-terminal cleavage/methylation domain-containing protein